MSQLGLLSITAPTDGSLVKVTQGQVHTETVYGRGDGLAQIYGGYGMFDIYLVVQSLKGNQPMWIQKNPAVVDRNTNIWVGTIIMGDDKNPPEEGETWLIVAVAASKDAGIGKILNITSLSQLPELISSNLVTVTSMLK